MNESKRRKREWVKTAAIVFLAVMLALTFFSSTIQNWSLPEVATQYVQSGTITAKVTITGNVESVDPYEVKVTESRKVASVAVRTGATVQEGDVLVYLEDKDSTELDAAKKELDAAQDAYDQEILNDKYTSSDISEARRGVTPDSYRDRITRAQNAVKAAENAVKAAEDAVAAAEDKVKGKENDGNNSKKFYNEKLEEINQRIKDLEKEIEYNTTLNDRAKASKQYKEAESNLADAKSELSEAESKKDLAWDALEDARDTLENPPQGANKAALEKAVETAERKYEDALEYFYYCESERDDAQKAYRAFAAPIEERENLIEGWENEITQQDLLKYNYEKEVAKFENLVSGETDELQKELDARKEELEESENGLKEKQEDLEELTIRTDNVIKLEKLLDAIDEAQKKVDELAENAGGTTITAPIAGTVTAVNVTAGNETSAAVPVVVMQREGQGYTLKYSASNDVAKRLSVGDVGTMSNLWRYPDVTVTLASIKPDPDSRGQNKLLTFNVTGSVVAGQSISFTVGQKSSNYNFIVPNSAIREDNNGKFILIVTSKGSPLGTRYTASRVDVQVIANDETQSAVSGALGGYEFVITTSTKPVEAGSLVRLPD